MTRHIDRLSIALTVGIAAALLGVGAAALASGIAKPWELVAVIVGGGILIAAAQPRRPPATVRNTYAHGAARAADENEALMAANRHGATQPLDTMEFDD